MNVYVYEDQLALNFEPLSLTRPVFDIRIGSETFLDRIKYLFPDSSITLIVRDNLSDIAKQKYPDLSINPQSVNDGIWLLGNVIWKDDDLISLTKNSGAFYYKEKVIAANLTSAEGKAWIDAGGPTQLEPPIKSKLTIEVAYCQFLWDIIDNISNSIDYEVNFLDNSNNEQYDENQSFINPDQIFINKSIIHPNVTINATNGPVIIDSGVEIHGPSCLEGPLYIGNKTLIKPLTQIKNSVIGPVCKIGGEIDSVIIQGYTNKVHDGHLGDAFLGEWVNLGAGTINSNLKNNYSTVKVQINGKSIDSKRIHMGCFIGDYVKTAIGTLLNTGSVIGPGAMIASDGFAPKTIKPFTWYIKGKHQKVNLEKFFETEKLVKERRGQKLSTVEKELIEKIIL